MNAALCSGAAAVSLILVLAAAFCPGPSFAAEPGEALELSLEDALNRAAIVSERVELARGELMRAQGERRIARSSLLPQLTASAAYTRTLRSQFDQVRGARDEGASDSDFLGAFGVGRNNQYTVAAELSQLLFDGGAALSGLRSANAREDAAETGVGSAEAQALLSVTQGYFDASLADSLLEIAEQSLRQAQTVLEQTELASRVGERSEFDLLRARVARANQEPTVRIRRNARDQALLSLKQLLDLPNTTPLELTTPIENLPMRFAQPGDTSAVERAPVRQARAVLASARSSLNQARRERFPAFTLMSRYAPTAFTVTGLPGRDDVRTDWTVGIGITLPIYVGGRIGGNIMAARGAVRRAQAQLEQAYEGAELDARVAQDDLMAAQEIFRSSDATAAEAQRAYEIAELRYRSGLASQVELLDTRLARDQALTTRAQAARDVQVARARLALLPLLPLQTPSLQLITLDSATMGTTVTAQPGVQSR